MRFTGPPQVFDIDAYSSSTIQNHNLGTPTWDTLGRMYRYGKAGASALVVGNLLQSPARDTAFTEMAVPTAVAAGATSLTVTLGATATTANMFDMGVLSISSSTGGGQQFTIKSHS